MVAFAAFESAIVEPGAPAGGEADQHHPAAAARAAGSFDRGQERSVIDARQRHRGITPWAQLQSVSKRIATFALASVRKRTLSVVSSAALGRSSAQLCIKRPWNLA